MIPFDTLEFVGPNDALLCSVGHELRTAHTVSLGGYGNTYLVHDGLLYQKDPVVLSTCEVGVLGALNLQYSCRAAPATAGNVTLRMVGRCEECSQRVDYLLNFDGGVLVAIEELLNGRM